MLTILIARFASLLWRWVDDLGTPVRDPRRFSLHDRSSAPWGGDGALRPAYARIRRERDRK